MTRQQATRAAIEMSERSGGLVYMYRDPEASNLSTSPYLCGSWQKVRDLNIPEAYIDAVFSDGERIDSELPFDEAAA